MKASGKGSSIKGSATKRKARPRAGKPSVEKKPPKAAPPVIVGIGASAGGLESISSLLKALPADTGMCFVVIQHLDPRQTSRLPSLLERCANMAVVEIVQDTCVAHDCVYVLAPGKDIWMEGGMLRTGNRRAGGGSDGQIDRFFTSLADECGDRAIGIVLSGTGTDGTEGLRRLKERGAITFAEDRSTAKFFGMPESAIASGAVDEVLAAAAIAQRVVRLAGHPVFRASLDAEKPAGAEQPQLHGLDEIFRILKNATGVNFSDYKRSTLVRRITRRMVYRRAEKLDDYAAILRKEPKEVETLHDELLIHVTSFFRDAPSFKVLSRQILPQILREKKSGDTLRIWVPGCSTGEEVYSICICVLETLARLKADLRVQIFGTDLSDTAIARARSGKYESSISRDVSDERLRRFFVRKDDTYRVSRAVRELCTFARQNLCDDPPFSRLDIISCRNVLIYLGVELQRKCLPTFYYALQPWGYLILGSSESIGSFADLFKLVDKKGKIYAKKPGGVPPQLKLAARQELERRVPEAPLAAPARPAGMRGRSPDIQSAADQLILTHFAPCGVVIDEEMQVWHFRGQTALFLEHAPGAASLNILKMVRHDLGADLSTAIHQALKQGGSVRRDAIVIQTPDGPREARIEVIPFSAPPSKERWLLVIFEDRGAAPSLKLPKKGGGSLRERACFIEVKRLREELASTKESLQAIIEEGEATNEELKSANEEIESSNEELQSTNEELETAKEELQSTNEELTTVNDELSSRNQEVSEINNDLNNLLSSIHIAIIMVDSGMTIRRITPMAEKLFNIIPGDIGRKLSDINPNIDAPKLIGMIHTVIDQLTPCEQEVWGRDGRWYSLRVRPYRTTDNVIDGAVITLLDVHDVKRGITERSEPAEAR